MSMLLSQATRPKGYLECLFLDDANGTAFKWTAYHKLWHNDAAFKWTSYHLIPPHTTSYHNLVSLGYCNMHAHDCRAGGVGKHVIQKQLRGPFMLPKMKQHCKTASTALSLLQQAKESTCLNGRTKHLSSKRSSYRSLIQVERASAAAAMNASGSGSGSGGAWRASGGGSGSHSSSGGGGGNGERFWAGNEPEPGGVAVTRASHDALQLRAVAMFTRRCPLHLRPSFRERAKQECAVHRSICERAKRECAVHSGNVLCTGQFANVLSGNVLCTGQFADVLSGNVLCAGQMFQAFVTQFQQGVMFLTYKHCLLCSRRMMRHAESKSSLVALLEGGEQVQLDDTSGGCIQQWGPPQAPDTRPPFLHRLNCTQHPLHSRLKGAVHMFHHSPLQGEPGKHLLVRLGAGESCPVQPICSPASSSHA
eukprot:1158136-Pelagomonas_calceolata.AAC.4